MKGGRIRDFQSPLRPNSFGSSQCHPFELKRCWNLPIESYVRASIAEIRVTKCGSSNPPQGSPGPKDLPENYCHYSGGSIEIFLAACRSVVHSHFCRRTEDPRCDASGAERKGLGTGRASGAAATGLGCTTKGSADQWN